ncbi:peptidase M23 [Thiocapsa imhoffii]|uniref:Peptidase M23 n=1 Tax=Thiocapsa imhoffii TaxID=382777 RepID=A0A9X0WF47_9GAMM|nr:M23 family metallopeptidase [Thiocapsa imhoffii]MBK1643376.1 peptidase M23 [Thiocapsa imhoffii]
MHHLDRRKHVRGQAVIALLAVTLFALAGAGLGYWIGYHQSLIKTVDNLPSTIRSPHSLLAPLLETTVSIEDLTAAGDLDAIAARLGEMQAELMRLNALGERLVRMSGLSPAEFDFENPPPRGGPEESPVRDYTIRELASELSSMVSLVQDRQRKLEVIEDVIMEKDLTAQAVPTGWPVRSGYVTSRFGFRVHPIRKSRSFHTGVDFASPRGSPVIAVADGVVTFSGRQGGYGRMVDIRHVNGLVTRYAHNQENLVVEGQMVRQGQKIATVGSSGTATGPHVHFEVLKNGKAVDPFRYIDRSPSPILASNADEQSG